MATIFFVSFLVWTQYVVPIKANILNPHALKNTIAIFGGTGKLGSECVYQALQRGDNVVVLARDKSKMTIPPGSGGALAGQGLAEHPQLKLIEGSVLNQQNVDKVFNGNAVTGVIIGESSTF
jgi:nucleoside-diphosphate-sugar epimerase